MNAKERYEMVLVQKQKPIIEYGFAVADRLQQYYFVCHSCKDGLLSMISEDDIVIQAIAHMASERHKILLGDY